MALSIGRRIASAVSRPPVSASIIGGSALAGTAGAVLDDEGPFPRIQEQAFGSRNAIKYSIKSGIMEGINPGVSNTGYEDYYYGRPVNIAERRNPVPGDVVFGMYNSRRV